MTKLTKRQDEVIRQLCKRPGRELRLGKGGYWSVVNVMGGPVPGLRGVANIVVTALARAQLIVPCGTGYTPTALALSKYRGDE